MNIRDEYPFDARIELIVRRARAERSLYLGLAIGNLLANAWEAMGGLARRVRRALTRRQPAAAQ